MRVAFDPTSAVAAIRDDLRARQATEAADALDAVLGAEYATRPQLLAALFGALQNTRAWWEAHLPGRRVADTEALMERLRLAMHGQ